MGIWDLNGDTTATAEHAAPASSRPDLTAWFDPRSRRVAAEDAVKGLSLPDAVLALVLIEERHPTPVGQPNLAIADFVPETDPSNLVAWMRAALALVRSAEEFGRRNVVDGESGPALVAAMAGAHPGFSQKSYSDVLFHGFSLVSN